jgi:hypothetical protein
MVDNDKTLRLCTGEIHNIYEQNANLESLKCDTVELEILLCSTETKKYRFYFIRNQQSVN